MANEFVARRGIIAQSGGAKITGSLLVSGTIDATGYNIIASSLTGSFSGSIGSAISASFATTASAATSITFTPPTASFAVTASFATNATIPAGTVSSSAQVIAALPGVVSSSGQIDYNSITNKLSGVISSSTQFNALGDTSASFATTASFALNATIPAGTVSASSQVDITATTNFSTFSSSLATVDSGQTTRIDNLASATSSYAINATIQGQLAGVASSSAQVKAFLPADTVSSSGQVSLTATTGYSTFSSSIATKNDLQDVSINSLNAATSSYAINATIQGQLAGVASSSAQVKAFLPADTVSSSAQVKAFLPADTVSSSGQVDITATTNFSTFSSSLATVDAGQTIRIDNLASLTSSYAINSTIQGQLAGVVSSSAQVKPLLPGGTVSSSNQVVVQNTTGIGALATTGSNTFTANQIITGSLFISENLTVLGSSSITFISQSTLNIGTNIITVNTLTPGTRFGGLSVIDSGSSPQRSGSLFFDSINDQWIFVHQNTAGGITSSVVLMGPATFDNIGNETSLTQNRLLKGAGLEHITDSQITDNGITVSITNGLSVGTNLTASNATITGLTANQAVFTDANDTLISVATTGTGDVVRAASPTLTGTLTAANITATGTMLLAGIISQSSQVSITGTTGYSTFSSSIATKNDLQDVSINALTAATSSYALQSQLAGVASSSSQVKAYLPADSVSSSTQVTAFLPGGTVSSSAQFPGLVTASSQIALASITGTTFASANFTFPQQLTVSGVLSGSTSAFISNTLYSGSIVTGIVGPVTNQVVASLSTASYDGVFFDYVVKDGTNYRTGTVMVVANGTNVEFTDTSTNDIGNTAQAIFTVDISGGLIRLKFTNTSGTWIVKTAIRAL